MTFFISSGMASSDNTVNSRFLIFARESFSCTGGHKQEDEQAEDGKEPWKQFMGKGVG